MTVLLYSYSFWVSSEPFSLARSWRRQLRNHIDQPTDMPDTNENQSVSCNPPMRFTVIHETPLSRGGRGSSSFIRPTVHIYNCLRQIIADNPARLLWRFCSTLLIFCPANESYSFQVSKLCQSVAETICPGTLL